MEILVCNLFPFKLHDINFSFKVKLNLEILHLFNSKCRKFSDNLKFASLISLKILPFKINVFKLLEFEFVQFHSIYFQKLVTISSYIILVNQLLESGFLCIN